jgi:hypothetical protein
VKVDPSQVRAGDLIPVIGAGLCPATADASPAGWSPAWGCPLWCISVAGAPEVLVQPQRLPVEVTR